MANSEMETERGRGWGSTQQNTENKGQQEVWGKTLVSGRRKRCADRKWQMVGHWSENRRGTETIQSITITSSSVLLSCSSVTAGSAPTATAAQTVPLHSAPENAWFSWYCKMCTLSLLSHHLLNIKLLNWFSTFEALVGFSSLVWDW